MKTVYLEIAGTLLACVAAVVLMLTLIGAIPSFWEWVAAFLALASIVLFTGAAIERYSVEGWEDESGFHEKVK